MILHVVMWFHRRFTAAENVRPTLEPRRLSDHQLPHGHEAAVAVADRYFRSGRGCTGTYSSTQCLHGRPTLHGAVVTHAAPAFTVILCTLYSVNCTNVPVIMWKLPWTPPVFGLFPLAACFGGAINTNSATANNGHHLTVDT